LPKNVYNCKGLFPRKTNTNRINYPTPRLAGLFGRKNIVSIVYRQIPDKIKHRLKKSKTKKAKPQ
jgi:hypothetical protein